MWAKITYAPLKVSIFTDHGGVRYLFEKIRLLLGGRLVLILVSLENYERIREDLHILSYTAS